MFWNGIYKAGRVAAPVLIHFLAANIVVIIGGMGLHIYDAALLTSVTALVVLPLFWKLFRQDAQETGATEKAALGGKDVLFLIALAVLCNYVCTMALNLFLQALPSELPNDAQEALFAGNLAVQILGVGIAVPVMEEVLFRGLVYNRLKGYTKTVWPAALLAAAIFAVYHGNWIQMLFAFPMGLLLVVLYQKWKTLKAPILFHAAVNLSSICMNLFWGD